MLDIFRDVNLGSFVIDEEYILNNVTLSFVPIHVPVEAYDHHISFDEDTFIGFEERDMKFVGNGSISHAVNGEAEHFDFEGPIGVLRLAFHLVD